MVDKIIVPRRRQDWFDARGELTLRAFRFFESLSDLTNDVAEDVEQDSGIGALNAQLLALQAQVGSGQPVTIDTSGFTIDNSRQSIDMAEA